MFGSDAWAHLPDEKQKALQPKSEKCIFVGYSKYLKGYIFIYPKSNEIIIRRDDKFDENVFPYKPNLTSISSSTYDPSSKIVPPSNPNFFTCDPTPVSTLYVDSEDENKPPPTHVPNTLQTIYFLSSVEVENRSIVNAS